MSESSRLLMLRKFYGFTQKKIAEDILNIGQNAYSMVETGRSKLTNQNRNRLVEKLKVNPHWLITGTGDMFIDPDIKTPPAQKRHAEQGVPYYTKQLTGPKVVTLEEIANADPEYYIDYRPFNDCSFYRPVYGESMSPKYNPGDTIACKKILNKENIEYGQAYLCIVNNGGDFYETIKTIRLHLEDKSLAILKPINPNFDESIIPIESIIELYIIKGKIERYT